MRELCQKERTCPLCGRKFIPERKDQEFCSQLCEEEYAQTEFEDWLFLLDEIWLYCFEMSHVEKDEDSEIMIQQSKELILREKRLVEPIRVIPREK